MGVQENQNCTVITMRMKGNRKRWSEKGANNMAKVLYRKENKELWETINRYGEGLIFNAECGESAKERWERESIYRRDKYACAYA